MWVTSPNIIFMRVDFPEPVSPTIPTRSPLFILRFKFLITYDLDPGT